MLARSPAAGACAPFFRHMAVLRAAAQVHRKLGATTSHVRRVASSAKVSVHRGSVNIEGPHTLHFEVSEAPSSSSGWGLLWAHGLSSSFQSESNGGWPFEGVPGLADLLSVARYDARGHGGSSESIGDCTWHAMGSDMVHLRRSWGKPKTILGGTSMGAAASLFAALKDTTDIAGLILATPPTCYQQRRKFVPMYRESVDLARRDGLEAAKLAAAGKARPPIFMETERGRDMFDIGWQAKFEMGRKRYCAALDGAAESDLPPPEKLKTLNIPALILAWQSDVQHPLESAEFLHQVLPQSSLHIARSWSQIEEFPAIMRDFLQALMSSKS